MLKTLEKLVFIGIKSNVQKVAILVFTLCAFLFAIWMIPSELVLAKMLPGKNNNTFSIYVDLPTGSSVSETKQVSECVINKLKNEKEVTDMELFLGQGAPLDFAGLIKGSAFKNSENVSEIVVNLTKKEERDEPSYMMVQRIRPEIQKSCEAFYDRTNIKFVEPPAGPPTLAAIVVEVYGDSAEGIRHLASRVEDVLKRTKGLVDVDTMEDEIYDTFNIKVNADKIARSHLSVKQVNDILYLAFEGMGIAVKNSDKYDDQIPLFLMLSPKSKKFTKNDKESIEAKLTSLKLMNNKGMMVPITEVVNIEAVKSHPMIMSKDLRQMTNVLAETDMVSQVYPLIDARSTIKKEFGDEYEISDGEFFNLILKDKKTGAIYKLKWDGEMKVTIDTFIQLGAAFIAALVLIFLLMVVYYKSFALSGIILLGSFLSIIGVIMGHYIMDLFTKDTFFLTATSLIGFIALIGISSRNSLLLIDFTKSLIHEKGMHKKEAIAYATAIRSKPIFLTAVAIILASTLLAGDAVFGGLGVSLIFGTVAAVISSLMVVPVLLDYVDLEDEFHYKTRKVVPLEDVAL